MDENSSYAGELPGQAMANGGRGKILSIGRWGTSTLFSARRSGICFGGLSYRVMGGVDVTSQPT